MSYHLHWVIALLMAIAVVPLFRSIGAPLQIDFTGMAGAYWIGTAAHALFVAVVLAVLGLPWQQTVQPLLNRYRQQKMRLPFLLIFAVWMLWLFGWSLGLVVIVDGIAVAELLDRGPDRFGSRIIDVLIPAAYLFFVVLLVYAYNHAFAYMKFAGAWDPLLNALDARVFGLTVSQAAGWFQAHLPARFYEWVEYAYSSLYGQVGAVLAVTALSAGRREAMRYVGTLMIAYTLALAIFFFIPNSGPFILRAKPNFPNSLNTALVQQAIVVKAQLLSQHQLAMPEIRQINLLDYYIGFPSMHVAMSLVAIWFARRWRRMALLLAVLNLLVFWAIVLLEWHYFIDLVGGVAVAAAAIGLTPRLTRGRNNSVGEP